MKKREYKPDPLIEAIKAVFPNAEISQGYEATKKLVRKAAASKTSEKG
jgi:hypothetical protein